MSEQSQQVNQAVFAGGAIFFSLTGIALFLVGAEYQLDGIAIAGTMLLSATVLFAGLVLVTRWSA